MSEGEGGRHSACCSSCDWFFEHLLWSLNSQFKTNPWTCLLSATHFCVPRSFHCLCFLLVSAGSKRGPVEVSWHSCGIEYEWICTKWLKQWPSSNPHANSDYLRMNITAWGTYWHPSLCNFENFCSEVCSSELITHQTVLHLWGRIFCQILAVGVKGLNSKSCWWTVSIL